jgi:SET domain-containing protein
MGELDKHLRVRRSGLSGAGKGLFTTKFIPKGTRIVEYLGTITSWKDVQHQEGKNGYIFYVKRNHVIDAGPHPEAIARYANDAKGLSKQKGLVNNAEYLEEGSRVFIVAKKDIPAGAEIFVDYGKEYWQNVRFNMKLDEQEKKKNGK